METTIRTSLGLALVLALFVTSCSDESETDTGTGGTAGAAGSAATGGGGGSAGTSGSSGSAGTAATGGSSGTAGASGTAGTSGTAGGGGAAGASTDADCQALDTTPKCRQCCGDLHTDGQKAYDAAYTDCVCKAGNCGSQCSQSVCANPAKPGPSQSCQTCLGDVAGPNGACSPATVEAACTDPSCAAYITCTSGCP